MGKTKQVKEKKFDRNVEISAPILDPEVIKAIHSPPKGQRLDIRHGGFKALLSDLNSQDSTDEITPIVENHVPSYVGISCAVSGYSNYSSYNKKPIEDDDPNDIRSRSITKSKLHTNTQTHSGAAIRHEPHHVNHIKIDKSTISSAGEELKELTEKLTASVAEKHRSPSPITPTEDDRHHGAYVGARYCPMPPPSKLVHKHIPLLGIDDEQDPDTVVVEDKQKVENKIASLYGDSFVEDWRESISHKAKKEHIDDQQEASQTPVKSPKDLVTLKPTPKEPAKVETKQEVVVDVPVPNCEVLKGVEKQFLNRLLTDENPPMPKTSSPQPMSPVSIASSRTTVRSETPQNDLGTKTDSLVNIDHSRGETPTKAGLVEQTSPTASPTQLLEAAEGDLLMMQDDADQAVSPITDGSKQDLRLESPIDQAASEKESLPNSPTEQIQFEHKEGVGYLDSPVRTANATPTEQTDILAEANIEKHIEGEIRVQSPVDNESSPVKFLNPQPVGEAPEGDYDKLVSLSPPPSLDANIDDSERLAPHDNNESPVVEVAHEENVEAVEKPLESVRHNNNNDDELKILGENSLNENSAADSTVSQNESKLNQDGHYYLNLLDQEKIFIGEQIKRAEAVLAEKEASSDEETLGRIRSAIGKANLLINKKCNQFKELCERSINEDAGQQFAVHNDDLAGFWDMLSIQFIDVRKSFELI